MVSWGSGENAADAEPSGVRRYVESTLSVSILALFAVLCQAQGRSHRRAPI
jgi:hypothetical protein